MWPSPCCEPRWRPLRRRGAGAGPDVPGRSQGARVLARDPADQPLCERRGQASGVGPAPRTPTRWSGRARRWTWGRSRARAIVVQTADCVFTTLTSAGSRSSRSSSTGETALRDLALPDGVAGPRRRRSARGPARWPRTGTASQVRIVSVVGTRPQLIKAAALQPELRRRHEEVFVDTGQHWDEAMAGVFFDELDLAGPTTRSMPGRIARRADAPDADAARADPGGRDRTRSWSTATRTRLSLARWRRPRWASRWLTSKPGYGASIGGCPRRSTGSSPTTCLVGCSRRRRRPSTTCGRGDRGGSRTRRRRHAGSGRPNGAACVLISRSSLRQVSALVFRWSRGDTSSPPFTELRIVRWRRCGDGSTCSSASPPPAQCCSPFIPELERRSQLRQCDSRLECGSSRRRPIGRR